LRSSDRPVRSRCAYLILRTSSASSGLRLTQAQAAVKAIELMLPYDLGRPIQTQNVRVTRSVEDLSEEELLALADAADEEARGTRH
jgi:hypothetical protein